MIKKLFPCLCCVGQHTEKIKIGFLNYLSLKKGMKGENENLEKRLVKNLNALEKKAEEVEKIQKMKAE